MYVNIILFFLLCCVVVSHTYMPTDMCSEVEQVKSAHMKEVASLQLELSTTRDQHE